jgi:hypothetical protein
MEFDAYRMEWMNGKPGDHRTIDIRRLPAIYVFSIVGNAPGKVYIDAVLLRIVLYQSIYFSIEVQVNYLFIATLVDISHDYRCISWFIDRLLTGAQSRLTSHDHCHK